jgi:7,8-dihydropterin-6-yl-methyl-4-(beta-D-ribofuranosyl)aminobenzene 5'-phosphate synthase
VLFDTGGRYHILARNAKALKADLSQLRAVVISHNHWDHTGGLWGLLKRNPGLRVHICPGFGKRLQRKIQKAGGVPVVSGAAVRIGRGLYLSGELWGRHARRPIAEQALVVTQGNTPGIITGCAHAGPVETVRAVKRLFPGKSVSWILGGLHLYNKRAQEIKRIFTTLKKMGLKQINACHCTGERALFMLKERERHGRQS